MNVTENSPLMRKLSAYVALSETENELLSSLHQRRKKFEGGRDLVYQGQSERAAYILAKGWACSYKTLCDGTRQIVDIQIPGDFLGLRNILLHTSDHSIASITDIEVSQVSASDLLDAFSENSRLAVAVLWAASRDEAMVVEHLIDLGCRTADERLAHFLLELGSRLTLIGKGDGTGYDCPLTQYHLADLLGLTAIHVNRALRKLREQGLVTFRSRRVSFDDYKGLVAFADYDPAYLDQLGPLLPRL